MKNYTAQTASNKTKFTATTLTLTLILSIAAATFALAPAVTAHDPPWEIPTWTFAAATNNPIGVGEDLTIVFWLNVPPPTAVGQYGDRWTFNLAVTKPDGSKDNIGPITSDPVGSGYAIYKPTQTGTYTFVVKFSEHTVTGLPNGPGQNLANVNDTYLASESSPITVTVQQQPIDAWPESQLPTRYWTRPINEANRNWWILAGNWLAGAAQVSGPTDRFGYGPGPESAHVMWATPMWAGGIMDSRFGDIGFQTGHYEGLNFVPPIILDGKIFYNVQALPIEGWYCLDLYTGETLFFQNTTGPVTGVSASSSGSIRGGALAFGQIFDYESPNQHGGFPYLWSTTVDTSNTWSMYDAETGNLICSIANVSASGTAVYGKDGSILRYNIVASGNNKRLTVWNTTQAIWWKPSWSSNQYWMWRPGLNETYDGNKGFSLNVSIPNVNGRIITVREDEFVIGGTSGLNRIDEPLELGNLWALSLVPGQEGTLLWNITYTPPYDVVPSSVPVSMYRGHVYGPTVDPEDGVFLFENSMTLERWGFNLNTGEMIWGPTPPEGGFQFYGMYDSIYEGRLFSYGYSGQLIAYNVTTGEQLWIYNATNVGQESPYGNYPIHVACIADGKLYLVSGEHSESQPLWRGSYIRCIDAATGEELWKVLHWGAGATGGHLTTTFVVVADGYLVGLNYYDNQIYCYGKGPSATSITLQNDVITRGESVLLKGSVVDVSSGAKQKVDRGEFSVVPCISDADQEAWMEYVYAQQNMPKDAVGVPISLDTWDPNGNYVHVGDVVSDASGGFKLLWTPQISGEYTIIASFGGSKSYYASSAQTYLGVVEPSASPAVVTPSPTLPTQPPISPTITPPLQTSSPSPILTQAPQPTSATPTSTYIAIGIAVIVIVAAAAALAMRRRK
jgi:outer membrane protein assembly factor BamB